jgi:hypothetical protein
MVTLNIQTRRSTAPATRPGLIRRLMRRFRDTRIQNAMYRIAPTRKM